MDNYQNQIAIVVRNSQDNEQERNIQHIQDIKNQINDKVKKKAYNELLQMSDEDIEKALVNILISSAKGQIKTYHVSTRDLFLKHSVLSKNFWINSFIFSRISAAFMCGALGIDD